MATDRQARSVDRIRVGVDAFNHGDVDAVLAILQDDVEIYSSPALANPGTYRGHDGYRQWVGQWVEAWEGLTMDIQRLEPVGERHVVVEVIQTAHGRGSGIPVEMPVTFMFELGDENAKALHLYATWDEAVASAERRERGD